jgi:hypothetical protein
MMPLSPVQQNRVRELEFPDACGDLADLIVGMGPGPREAGIRPEGPPFPDPFGGILEGGFSIRPGRADFAPLTITEAALLLGLGIPAPLFNFDNPQKALRGPVYC